MCSWQFPHCSWLLYPCLTESQKSQQVCFLMTQETRQKEVTFHSCSSWWITVLQKRVHKYAFRSVALLSIFCMLWLMNLKWALVRMYNSSISLHTCMILSQITNLTYSRYSHSVFHPNKLWPQTELRSIPEIQNSIWSILFLSRETKAMLIPPSSQIAHETKE